MSIESKVKEALDEAEPKAKIILQKEAISNHGKTLRFIETEKAQYWFESANGRLFKKIDKPTH